MRPTDRLARAAFLPLLLVTCLACTFSGSVHQDMREIDQGLLTSSSVTIRAEDGSFVLEGGKPFTPPHSIDTYNNGLTDFWNDSTVANNHVQALGLGGTRVLVEFAGQPDPLYGVLLLSQVHDDTPDESYTIQIDPGLAAAAQDGRIAAQWQRYTYDEDEGSSWFAWVLWVSDRPLP